MPNLKQFLTALAVFSFLIVNTQAATFKVASSRERNGYYVLFVEFGELPQSIPCGLSVNWGDGSSEELRVGQDLDWIPSKRYPHTYTAPGVKSIEVKGTFLLRGLGSVRACDIDSKTEFVFKDPEVEKSKQKADALVARQKADELKAAERAKQAEIEEAAKAKATADALEKEKADQAAKLEAEEKERLFRLTPEYKIQQTEIAKQKLKEEKAAAARAKKEQADALVQQKLDEKRRQQEEKEQLAREKAEQKAAEVRRLEEEKIRAEVEKRQQAEAALYRPLILRQDPRIACQVAVEFDTRFAVLVSKMSLTGLTPPTFAMLANQSLPSAKEQQAISLLADEVKKCVTSSARYRALNYAGELNSLLDKEDMALLDAYVDMFTKKINFGAYNKRVQQIGKESLSALTTLDERLKAEKVAQEEAFRRRFAAEKAAALEQKRRDDLRRQNEARQEAQARELARQQQELVDLQRKQVEMQQQAIQQKQAEDANRYSRCMFAKSAAYMQPALGGFVESQRRADEAFNNCMR